MEVIAPRWKEAAPGEGDGAAAGGGGGAAAGVSGRRDAASTKASGCNAGLFTLAIIDKFSFDREVQITVEIWYDQVVDEAILFNHQDHRTNTNNIIKSGT